MRQPEVSKAGRITAGRLATLIVATDLVRGRIDAGNRVSTVVWNEQRAVLGRGEPDGFVPTGISASCSPVLGIEACDRIAAAVRDPDVAGGCLDRSRLRSAGLELGDLVRRGIDAEDLCSRGRATTQTEP